MRIKKIKVIDEEYYDDPKEDTFDTVFPGTQYTHPLEIQYIPDDLPEGSS